MPIPSLPSVDAHWCNLLEGCSLSSLEFYSAVEECLGRRCIPSLKTSRVLWNEGGAFCSQREYLRVARGSLVVDICGAPYGTGFFVSSWTARLETVPWQIALLLLTIAPMIAFFIAIRIFGMFLGFPLFFIGYPIAFWVFVQVMKENEGWDDPIVNIPYLGPIYERIFRPTTYYSIDTMLMFQQSVHNAVLEAVEATISTSCLRPLTPAQREPSYLFAQPANPRQIG